MKTAANDGSECFYICHICDICKSLAYTECIMASFGIYAVHYGNVKYIYQH